MTRGRKTEPKLALDMDFGEALARCIQTKPAEVAESIERSKKKKPPGSEPPGGLEKSKDGPPGSRGRKPPGG